MKMEHVMRCVKGPAAAGFLKKIFAVVAAVALLFSAMAFADDLSSLTDDELHIMYQDVLDEMSRRWPPEEAETENDQAAVTERVLQFFYFWSAHRYDDMLKLCGAGWKAAVDDPRAELLSLLAGRTAVDIEIESADETAGETPDSPAYYHVIVTSYLDRHDGTPYSKYRIHFLVRKEEDGLWYINPADLDSCEAIEEESSAETDAADMVKDTVTGNMKTYREMADGTWICDGYVYHYRLEIKGRLPNAAADSSFVYLSNIKDISFEQAYMAAGLSSDSDDYFPPEEAVLVEIN